MHQTKSLELTNCHCLSAGWSWQMPTVYFLAIDCKPTYWSLVYIISDLYTAQSVVSDYIGYRQHFCECGMCRAVADRRMFLAMVLAKFCFSQDSAWLGWEPSNKIKLSCILLRKVLYRYQYINVSTNFVRARWWYINGSKGFCWKYFFVFSCT